MAETYSHNKHRSGSSFAWILIVVGIILLIKQTELGAYIPGISTIIHAIGSAVHEVVHFVGKIGWPIFLIIAGVILLTGRRILGTLILILLLLFILPNFIVIPGILLFLFFPLILLVVGIIILSKMF